MAEVLSPLANPAATRDVLEEHGLATKHALGQNFLINDAILQKIVELAGLSEADDVLEVGPGIGTLSIALLKRAGRVVAVERDRDLPAVLKDTLDPWADRFALVSKDALDLTEDDVRTALSRCTSRGSQAANELPRKFVANLPYAVAATLVLDFFERFDWLESATVMVQKEVAERMCARPGTKNYGAYTVKLRLYAQAVGQFPVSPNNFFPPPHVDSAVIRLNRRPMLDGAGNALSDEMVRAACTMADAAFASRRKTIANSFKMYFASRGNEGKAFVGSIGALLDAAGIDAKRRGETLDMPEFIELARAYSALA